MLVSPLSFLSCLPIEFLRLRSLAPAACGTRTPTGKKTSRLDETITSTPENPEGDEEKTQACEKSPRASHAKYATWNLAPSTPKSCCNLIGPPFSQWPSAQSAELDRMGDVLGHVCDGKPSDETSTSAMSVRLLRHVGSHCDYEHKQPNSLWPPCLMLGRRIFKAD